jgi:hypothetical protein
METVACPHCGRQFERPVGSDQTYFNKNHKRAAGRVRSRERTALDGEVTG